MSSGDRKAIKDNIRKIDKYWKQRAKDNPDEIIDLVGEDAYLNILDEEYKENICYACGKECKPQRAHIVPDCLGGEPEPDNLFLLCVSCHQNNPDTIYKDMFFNYVKGVPSHLNTRLELVYKYLNDLVENAPKEDTEKFMKAVELGNFAEKFLYVDINESCLGLSNVLSEATLVSLAWKRSVASQTISA